MPTWRRPPLLPPPDPGLQQERTLLAWRRTTLSMGAGALVIVRLSLTSGGWSVTVPLLVLALASVAWCWVIIARRTHNADELHDHPGFRAVVRDGRLPVVMAAIVGVMCLSQLAVALGR